MGGGQYRTTLFPSDDSGKNDKKTWVPPISMMAIVGFTNTQASLPPPTASVQAQQQHCGVPDQLLLGRRHHRSYRCFCATDLQRAAARRIWRDPFGHTWTWDNTDIRYADSTSFGDLDVTYGITANNNPTVQDPWNTTPAWAFPYAVSTLAPGRGRNTIIDGTFAAHVGSVGAYAYINDVLYLEASVYHTL